MAFISGLIAGLLVGGVAIRIAYREHIAIAQDVISAELAKEWAELAKEWVEEWVEQNNVDLRF